MRTAWIVVLSSGLAWIATFLPLSAVSAAPSDGVGRVVALEGSATVERAGAPAAEPVAVDTQVFQGDLVRTRRNSKLKLAFIDGTVTTLGSEATFQITKFALSRERKRESLLFRITSGVLRVVVPYLPGSSVQVRTRAAVAAVRGTHMMVKMSDACEFFVVKGQVAVSHADAAYPGEVVLSDGFGTEVRGGQPLGTATRWDAGRVQRLTRDTALE